MWQDGRAEVDGLCKVHLATHVNDETFVANAQTRARNRVHSNLEAAAAVLEDLMQNATSEPVRADAAKQFLAMGGIRAGMEIEVTGKVEVSSARDLVAEKLEMLAQAARIEEANRQAELEARTVNAEEVQDDA